MTETEILAALREAYPLWQFTHERGVWRVTGPVIITATEIEHLLMVLAVADPAATAASRRKGNPLWKKN